MRVPLSPSAGTIPDRGAARVPDPAHAPALDGRRARVVDAFIDLVLEGNLPPSAEQVAKRAGISMATLFRHVERLDQLRRDAAARAFQRFPRLFVVPDVGVGPRAERIARFAATRVELWERTHLLARLLRSNALRDPGAAELVRFARTTVAEQVRRHFDPELRALTAAQREDAVATIASLTSVESWEQFRHAHARSPLQTRRAWARAIGRILAAR